MTPRSSPRHPRAGTHRVYDDREVQLAGAVRLADLPGVYEASGQNLQTGGAPYAGAQVAAPRESLSGLTSVR